jgi:hypothetical protein
MAQNNTVTKQQSKYASDFVRIMSEVFEPCPKERPIFWFIQDKVKTMRKVKIQKQQEGK